MTKYHKVGKGVDMQADELGSWKVEARDDRKQRQVATVETDDLGISGNSYE